MQLLTKKLRDSFPPLYSTESEIDPEVICKFYLSGTNWQWFAIEFDGLDTFYGFVKGYFPELGYFSLSELEKLKGPLGLRVERDIYFKPQPLSKIKGVDKK